MLHIITGSRNNHPTVIMPYTPLHIAMHTPMQRDYSWWMIDSETGEVIKSYIPKQKIKQKPCTPYKGSWAESLKQTA